MMSEFTDILNDIPKFLFKLNFQKTKVVSGNAPLFVIGTFYSPHSICLNIHCFLTGQFYGNVAFCMVVLSTTKRIFRGFLIIFQKTCFKIK